MSNVIESATARALKDCRKMIQEAMKILNDITDENTESINKNEDAVCELSETTEISIADLEQAICDLSEEVSNG